jgi:hypothetical protein
VFSPSRVLCTGFYRKDYSAVEWIFEVGTFLKKRLPQKQDAGAGAPGLDFETWDSISS